MGALSIILAAGEASAHTSYLLPSVFSTGEDSVVTLQASFGERHFFRPEVAVTSDDFHIVRPDGRRDTYDRIEVFQQITVLESDLAEPGTYRFTTGERLGRVGSQILIDGAWKPLEPGAAPPAGAQVRTSQTATVADVYVTKGAPTRPAVEAPSGRLAFQLDAHPSEIYLDAPLTVTVLFDGVARPNQEVELDREGAPYEEQPFHQELRTDAAGRLTLRFDRPGAYLIMTRHAAEAPTGAATDMRSYTTSLTFEVLK